MGLYSVVRSAALRYYGNDAEKAANSVFWRSSWVAGHIPFVAGISRLALSPPGHKKSFGEVFPGYEGPHFQNILSVPAGFDKYCSLAPLTYSFGFGWHVSGSISLHEWRGNNIAPRVVSLPDFGACWNRTGLDNIGAVKAKERLQNRNPDYVLFASIVQTPSCTTAEEAIKDICSTFDILYSLVDGFEINLSCPNTAEGKTFENPETLEALLVKMAEVRREIVMYASFYDGADIRPGSVRRTRKKPVLLKLSPGLEKESYRQLFEVGNYYGVSGYTLANTLPAQQWINSIYGEDKVNAMAALVKIGGAAWNENLLRFEGGISGKPLERFADEAISVVSPLLHENQLIVGVGNFNPENAAARLEKFPKVRLIQSYTPFMQSPDAFFVRRTLKGVR